jgi:hypothetical protein
MNMSGDTAHPRFLQSAAPDRADAASRSVPVARCVGGSSPAEYT